MSSEDLAGPSRPGAIGRVSTTALARLVVLSILREASRGMYGAEIRSAFEARIPTEWKPSDNLLYNAVLYDMDRRGWIKADSPRPRRRGHNKVFYAITRAGLDKLEEEKDRMVPPLKDAFALLQSFARYIYGEDFQIPTLS